jgi:glycosyltransferase involved in cell wall biosynthesis
LHILYLHNYFCPPGGWGNNRSFEFSQVWAQHGNKVTVLTTPAYFPDKYALPHRIQYGQVTVYIISSKYSQSFKYWRRSVSFLKLVPRSIVEIIGNIFRKEGIPDVVYASSTPLTVPAIAYFIRMFYHIPYVFEAVDVWPQVPIGMGIIDNKILVLLLHYFTDKLYRNASHIITLSEGMKLQILERRVPEKKIDVVHNGTNTDIFFPTNLPKSTGIFIYAGSIGAANRVDYLIEAAKKVGGQWKVYGDGSMAKLLQAQANDLNKYMGYTCFTVYPPVPKSQLNDILNSANVGVSVFANYSVLEANAANKFYDYLAAGLPVLTNYRGWQSEFLEKYQCGYAAKQGDIDDFIRGAKLLANSGISRQARDLAVNFFDRRLLALKALDILYSIKK